MDQAGQGSSIHWCIWGLGLGVGPAELSCSIHGSAQEPVRMQDQVKL